MITAIKACAQRSFDHQSRRAIRIPKKSKFHSASANAAMREAGADYNRLIQANKCQLIASLTGFPTRLSISTSVSMVNLAVFLFTTSDTRGRETIKISAASACFR